MLTCSDCSYATNVYKWKIAASTTAFEPETLPYYMATRFLDSTKDYMQLLTG